MMGHHSIDDWIGAYVDRGWFVFPIHEVRDGVCTCPSATSCSSPGKHPRTRNGHNDATLDVPQLARFWSDWPWANAGIACEPSGVVVLDVDPRNGGKESFEVLVQNLGPLPNTVESLTGGGGFHLYFKAPPGAPIAVGSGKLAPGIDIKAKGGYAIVPPSNHVTGGSYAWREGRSPLELEVADLPRRWIDAIRSLKSPPPAAQGKVPKPTPIVAGERNVKLTRIAGAMRRHGAAQEAIESALREVNALQCEPPLPEREVLQIVRSVDRYEPAPKSSPSRRAETVAGRRVLLGSSLDGPEQPYEWVEHGILARGFCSLLFGAPGSGKTFLAYAWAAQVLKSGQPVLIVDEDSGPATLRRRFRALGLGQVAIDELLHYFPFPGFTMADAGDLKDYVLEISPALVIIDSVVDLLGSTGAGENDASAVNEVLRSFATDIARASGAGFILIDHPQKDAQRPSPRGSGAKVGKLDVDFHVKKLTDFDPKRVGTVELTRGKNRIGEFVSKAVFRLGGTPDGFVFERLGTDPYAGADRRLVHFLTSLGADSFTRPQVEAALLLKKNQASALIRQATDSGLIQQEGQGRATRYFAFRPLNPQRTISDDSAAFNRPIHSSPLEGEESDETP